jgi:hypothetical protein
MEEAFMPSCSKCGASIQIKDKFCASCGQPITLALSRDDVIDAGVVCPKCDTYNEPGARICASCGQSLSGLTGYLQPVMATDIPPPKASSQKTAEPAFQLRLLSGDPPRTHPLGESCTLGRAQGTLTIGNDPFLAPEHLFIKRVDGQVQAEDLNTKNGSYLRVRSRSAIRVGSEFISGRSRFSLLGVGGPTMDVRIKASRDTRAYGSPIPKQLFVALQLKHVNQNKQAVAGSVILRHGPMVSVGREDCDWNVDDSAMAARQFEIHISSEGLVHLVEADSSQGVYVKMEQPTMVQDKDEMMIGDQILRIEKIQKSLISS